MSGVETGGGEHEKGKPKKMSTRTDFTPMVDLGFLLITFFMLTTSMSKPQTMEIAMPSKEKVSEEQKTTIKASKAVTIILGKDNKVFYYEGTRENEKDPVVESTTFDKAGGIRKYLIKRKKTQCSDVAKSDRHKPNGSFCTRLLCSRADDHE